MRPRPHIALALLVVVVGLVALVLAVTLGGSSAGNSPSFSNPVGSDGLDGAALPEAVRAPAFTLTDQYGRRFSLSETRGHVTVIAFVYSTCGNACVVIAQQIRGALDELGHSLPVLLVSAKPAADTPARIAAFLSEVSLSGRVQYLTGSLAQLRSVWRDYKIKPASAGGRIFDSYASVLLLDANGRERDVFELEQLTPESLAHDIRKLEDD